MGCDGGKLIFHIRWRDDRPATRPANIYWRCDSIHSSNGGDARSSA
jgi:hypothetical protein